MASTAAACIFGQAQKGNQNDGGRARGGAQSESPAMFQYFAHNGFSFRFELFLLNAPHDRLDNVHPGGGLAAGDQALLQAGDCLVFSPAIRAGFQVCPAFEQIPRGPATLPRRRPNCPGIQRSS